MRRIERCKLINGIFLLIISLNLWGCTGTKFLKENESFYTGAEINFDTQGKRVGRKKILREELQEYIQPKPNKKFLGMRSGVWFYFIAGTPKKEKGGLRNFIKKKLGKPPVLFSEAKPDRTAKTLNGQLHNEGYFQSKVSFETKSKKKETKVIYNCNTARALPSGYGTISATSRQCVCSYYDTVKREFAVKRKAAIRS